ncbi:MAG TPA: prolipoprotein diacylglyceryl transferase family protein [Candidatus Binatia bacterium]|nr:prolipoprotein diacylglyceryl transferase family protein [Candidatus Binatia bacterium]
MPDPTDRRFLTPATAVLVSLAVIAAAIAAAATAGGVPFFTLPVVDVGVPIQPFGTIVVAGVLIGAAVLRRHAARSGIDPDDARSLTLWVILTGAVGAHVFEALMYQRARLAADPLFLVKLWDGISSYGGFIGGAIGYVAFVRWKRLPAGAVADATILGLLVAFSIGRIGCTIIHDHIGAATTFWTGTDYPHAELARRHLLAEFPGAGAIVRAHNLGMYELLYLLPVNALALSLAFGQRRLPPGFVAALVALLYVPVRFALEFLRLDVSDPRYAGLTFAQWCSFLAFGAAVAAAVVVWTRGERARARARGDGERGGGAPRAKKARALAARRRL